MLPPEQQLHPNQRRGYHQASPPGVNLKAPVMPRRGFPRPCCVEEVLLNAGQLLSRDQANRLAYSIIALARAEGVGELLTLTRTGERAARVEGATTVNALLIATQRAKPRPGQSHCGEGISEVTEFRSPCSDQ